MFKRFRWISMGAAVGFGGSVWAQRRVKRTVGRYVPERMSAGMAQQARYLAEDVRGALDEGREAMRDREEELRRQLGVARPGGPATGISRPGVSERALPSAVPRSPRTRRRARAAPIIDVAEGHVHDRAEPSPPRRRGPRRRGRGE